MIILQKNKSRLKMRSIVKIKSRFPKTISVDLYKKQQLFI